jgi:uncharacterized protein YqjF (DUF2071 family)
MSSTFLTAEWRKLIMANYAVDPQILKPFLPDGTELDTYNNIHYVSLVGFLFDKVKLKGIPIPFHTRFEEVNLRFYVRHFNGKHWQRGVVFISEIVPKPAITLVARLLYGEKYSTMPMKHQWNLEGEIQQIGYGWKKNGEWYSISVHASKDPKAMVPGGEAEFIFEHYWGFTTRRNGQTGTYAVSHPRWQVYPVQDYSIKADFGKLYGAAFTQLNLENPLSVFLAEGSAVAIKEGLELR